MTPEQEKRFDEKFPPTSVFGLTLGEDLKDHINSLLNEERSRITRFTRQRADEQYYIADGIALQMRNKGYNDGMRAVEKFLTPDTNQTDLQEQ